jgi:hypothetical protein
MAQREFEMALKMLARDGGTVPRAVTTKLEESWSAAPDGPVDDLVVRLVAASEVARLAGGGDTSTLNFLCQVVAR